MFHGSTLTVTFDTATNVPVNSKSQVQGITLALPQPVVAATRTASATGFWDEVAWESGVGSQTGGVNDGDTVLIGRYRDLIFRGIPAQEDLVNLYIGENSVNPGQGTLVVESGNLHVTRDLDVGRNVSENDSFLFARGGTLEVDRNATFGTSASSTDGSLILEGGNVHIGGDLELGAFSKGGAMLRLHNPGISPAAVVDGALVLGRCALNLTFDSTYMHVPGTVTTVATYGSRRGQFLNHRNGEEFNCGPNRFRVNYAAGAGAITLTALPNWPASTARPNIIMILADDQGYADLSLNGDNRYPMPRLDSLATAGARFTNSYVTGGVCHPTRCGLLTGRYQQRTGNENNLGGPSYNGMSVAQTTIPERLQGLGYETYGVGKWHLGYTVEFHPNNRGFDHWYGMWAGSRSYYDSPTETGVFQRQMTPDFASENTDYLTDRIGDATVQYIDEHVHSASASKPFFIYMSFTAVHAPTDIKNLDPRFARLQNEFGLTATDYQNSPYVFPDTTQATTDARRFSLAAMTLALDENVGKVIDKVVAEGLTDNTLIVYLSDNGGAGYYQQYGGNFSYNFPLSGWKGAESDEGSIRVPCAAVWPGVIASGGTIDEPISSLDWAATFVNGGGDAPVAARNGLDGLDLTPLLDGTGGLPADRVLFWRTNGVTSGGSAARMGDWKLLINDSTRVASLYNLTTDIGETTDLKAQQPAIFNELMARYLSWESRIIPSFYGTSNTKQDTNLGMERWGIPGGLLVRADSATPLFHSGTIRDPISLASDFAFSFQLRPSEAGPYAAGAGLWNALGDSNDRAGFIRFGVDFATSRLRIVEEKTGNNASAPVTLPVGGFGSALVRYNAASQLMTLAMGSESVSLTLNGNYGPLNTTGMGVSAIEGEITQLRPVTGTDGKTLFSTALPANPVGLTVDLGAEPSFDPVVERSIDLTDFHAVPEALVESLGGGHYRVTSPSAGGEKEFYRFRFDRR